MALEDLEDDMQRSVEELLERTRQHNEDEVRAFVSELLAATTNERATALEDGRRVAETESEKAVQAEGDRVRADVEQIWAAKLQQANDTADDRFDTGLRVAREEAERELSRTVASVRDKGQKVLVAALGAAHLESDRTLALRVEQAREEAERTIAAAASVASEPTPVEPDRSDDDERRGRLLEGIRRLDEASRLTDVLDTLSELVGHEAPRTAVLSIEADRVRGWRFVGFGSTLDANEARQVDLACGEVGIVGRAVVTGETCSVVCGPNGVPEGAEPAFTTLPPGVEALAVPVRVGGQVMVVVYGDDAERRPPVGWRESLEALARHAGHCLAAVTAARVAQLVLQDTVSRFPEDTGPTLPFDLGEPAPSDA